MLMLLLLLGSIANAAGGLALIGTWAGTRHRVSLVVPFIGTLLLAQGALTLLYLRTDLVRWAGSAVLNHIVDGGI